MEYCLLKKTLCFGIIFPELEFSGSLENPICVQALWCSGAAGGGFEQAALQNLHENWELSK